MGHDLPLLGFGLPVSGSWATPTTMVHVARRAEELGYSSLWTFQRMLTPTPDTPTPDIPQTDSRRSETAAGAGTTPNPGARTIDDPAYRSVHDPLLPLAFVAGHTERIRLGTATVCAPFTPPALLAKSMATLDHLTAGRLTVGLGMGWLPQEYAAANVPFDRRGARMDEYLRCLVALWTEDLVEFRGEFWTVPRSHSDPKPVQSPHPPLLLGGAAPAALRRAGRLAQGWISSSRQDLTRIGEAVDHVRAGAREVGRDPADVQVLVRALVELVDRDPGPGRKPFRGTREQLLDDLDALGRQGVTEVFVDLNFAPRVGSPDADPNTALAEADRVLDALAPARR